MALITDGRFSGATRGLMVGHVAPEAWEGGPIAMVRDGDLLEVDVPRRKVLLDLSSKELGERSRKWKRPKLRYTSGVLAKYSRLVGSASEGAICA